MNTPCPCHSGKAYQECCRPYHEEKAAENALLLMRSRYSAYALGFAEYIIATTHPNNPARTVPRDQWEREICSFSKNTAFDGLTIVEFVDGKEQSSVTFTAVLRQGGRDVSFTEKSLFKKVHGTWLYLFGDILSAL